MNTNTTKTRLLLGSLALFASATLVLSGCTTTQSGDKQSTAPTAPTVPDGDGPGVTADSITLQYDALAFAGDDAQKAKSIAAMKAVVDALNKDGGISGRKVIIPETYVAADLMKQRQDAYNQAGGLPVGNKALDDETCAAIAKADPFFAHIGVNLFTDPFGGPSAAACVNKAGHPIVELPASWTKADFTAAPYTAGVGLTNDRILDAYKAAAKDAGLDKSAPLVVIVAATAPDAGKQYVSAFEAEGFSKVTATPVDSAISAADAVNLVVKLRGDGVKTLVYANTTETGIIGQTLVQALGQQQFAPIQLGVDTNFLGPNVTVTDEVNAQMRIYSSVRRYFQPTAEQEAETKATPAGKLCAEASAAAPELGRSIPLALCDDLTFLKAALEAGDSTKGLNANTFATGVAALKDTYKSPAAFGLKFSATDHGGVNAIVPSTYVPAQGTQVLGTKIVTF